MDIYIPNYVEVELATPDKVRTAADGRPDTNDVLEWDQAHWAPLEQHHKQFLEGRVVITNSAAIGANGPYGGNSSMPQYPRYSFGGQAMQRPSGGMANVPGKPAIPAGCPTPTRDGGTPNPPCEPLIHCGVAPLGFNTLGNANFPLAGVAAGTFTESQQVEVTSGRSQKYKASWLYVSARDQAAGFAVSGFGALTEATVNRNSQLTGDTLVNRPLISDLFLQVGPLPLDDWREWTNTAPNTLQLTFGNAQGAAVTLQYAGAFWGESLG